MHVSAYCRLSLDKFRLSFQVPGSHDPGRFPNFRDYQRPNQGISGLESVTKLNTMVGVLHFTNFYWLLLFYFYTSYKERVNGSKQRSHSLMPFLRDLFGWNLFLNSAFWHSRHGWVSILYILLPEFNFWRVAVSTVFDTIGDTTRVQCSTLFHNDRNRLCCYRVVTDLFIWTTK